MDTPDHETAPTRADADLSTLSDDTRRMGEAAAEANVGRAVIAAIDEHVDATRAAQRAALGHDPRQVVATSWEVIAVEPATRSGPPWTMPDGWEPFGIAPSGRIMCRRQVR